MKTASAMPTEVRSSLSGRFGSTARTWIAATNAKTPNSAGSSRGTAPAEKQRNPIRVACSRNSGRPLTRQSGAEARVRHVRRSLVDGGR